MKTKTISKKDTVLKSKKGAYKKTEIYEAVLKNAIHEDIATDLIDESPFNRRTFYNQKSLEELAAGMKVHGVLHDIAVRPKQDERYELMFGHRRLRAARIAGLKTIPAKVAPATDEQAKEIIFSENIHRENPHPMDEANSIMDMMEAEKTIEEIASRLGKSTGFVYSRMKLIDLIEPIQEVFLNDKISIREAMDIASLSKDSQQELFKDCFANWKQENFRLHNLSHSISQYLYDLNKAPFDTKDENLLPDIGGCTTCPFNSATLKTLFPELAESAICANKICYKNKCDSHLKKLIADAFNEVKPDALVFYGVPSETLLRVVDAIPGASDLPQYNGYATGLILPPELPDKEEYFYENEEGEGERIFAEEEYNDAMTEYLFELEQFNDELQSPDLKKGLLIGEGKVIKVVLDTTGRSRQETLGEQRVTSKAIQEAIKAGTVTPEFLQKGIERINERAQREQELCKEKIQLQVHKEFEEQFGNVENNQLTTADLLAARLIIYQSLDYSTRNKVDTTLFGNKPYYEERKDLLPELAKLTDQEFAYLIRMALAGKADSKTPKNVTSKCLYAMAESGGLDVKSIEKDHDKKTKERIKKMKQQIKDLEKRIERMKLAA